MYKTTTRTRLLILGAMTWLAGAAWIGSEIYHGYITDKISEQYESEINPLNPTINIEILNKLSSKRTLKTEFPTYTPPTDEPDSPK